MAIINCTPHVINVITPNGETITIPPSGIIPRIAISSSIEEVIDGVEISSTSYGKIENLPSPNGDIFVVSALVAGKAMRRDVVSPGPLVRGENGQPIGCRGLSRQGGAR
jgi:hypothetical protein